MNGTKIKHFIHIKFKNVYQSKDYVFFLSFLALLKSDNLLVGIRSLPIIILIELDF